jgi:transcriptional regulator with XRE-family HTH domain
MTIHLGQILHELVESKNVPRKEVAACMSVTEGALYKIFKKEDADVLKIENLSRLLNVNLFDCYSTQESMKEVKGTEANWLRTSIGILQDRLEKANTRVKQLEEEVADKKRIQNYLQQEFDDYRNKNSPKPEEPPVSTPGRTATEGYAKRGKGKK